MRRVWCRLDRQRHHQQDQHSPSALYATLRNRAEEAVNKTIIEAAFEAGFKDCRDQAERILVDAEKWKLPYELSHIKQRRFMLNKIRSEVEKLVAIRRPDDTTKEKPCSTR